MLSLLSSSLTSASSVTTSRPSARGLFRAGFELCVVAREPGADAVRRALRGEDRTLQVNFPAVLSSRDLKRATAVTTSSWSLLSARHPSSTLVLHLKPEAAIRFKAVVKTVIERGDRIAIMLHDEIIGVLLMQHEFSGNQLAIDGAFFSEGAERDRESETRILARQIAATIY